MLRFYRYQVASIEYQGPKGKVVLEKKAGSWKLKKPKSRDIDDDSVDALLTALGDIEVERFIDTPPSDLASVGLQPPEGRIVLKKEDGEELGTMLISGKGPKGEKDLFYAKNKKEAWIGLISKEKKQKLVDKLAPFFEEA